MPGGEADTARTFQPHMKTANKPMGGDQSYSVAARDISGPAARQAPSSKPTLAVDLLIIEDNPQMVEVLAKTLSCTRSGRFAVRAAHSLEQALDEIRSGGIEAIVLDLALPDSAGVDTFRRVHAAAGHLPIVILSGTDDEELAVQLVQEGAQDYFIKGEGNMHLLPRAIRYSIERKRAEEELQASERQLHALAARLQTVLEDDRIRIARELHDQIGQSLALLRMNLAILAKCEPSSEALQERARSMSEVVDSTIRTVRGICGDLRPRLLDDLGLVAALNLKAQQFQECTSIACHFSASGNVHLENARSTALFRIAQEALTNILRHAAATRIDIRLNKDCDRVELSIEDNGRGITDEEITQRESLGLLGMRERVQVFGGCIEISGLPRKGTTVRVHLPLQK